VRWFVVIIADAGVWVGLADRRDRNHEICRRFFRQNREPLITTFPVLTETVHLLFQRVGVAMTLTWLDTIENQGTCLFQLGSSNLLRVRELMRHYDDLPMDLADASLVILAEHLGHGRIVSTDRRDFRAYRWKNREPFSNLLEPLP
jgi:predicted nucleic acid-binding protein